MKCVLFRVCGAAWLAFPAWGQSNVDATNRFSWAENAGWLNWRDAGSPSGAAGVRFHESYLSGYIWAENLGWIDVGDGTPGGLSGGHPCYANADSADFGVNRQLMTNELSGLAWGENVGWINFSGGALATPPQPARIASIAGECRLLGYVWSRNIGWISLDDGTHYVAAHAEVCTSSCGFARGDANCDEAIDFFDIDPLLFALFDPTGYSDAFCGGSFCAVDVDCSGAVDFFDIDPFLACVFGACSPCP